MFDGVLKVPDGDIFYLNVTTKVDRWIGNSLVVCVRFYCTFDNLTLREKCPYSELFWSTFSSIRTEYGEIRSISPYSVRMQENTDQNNFEHGHSLRSVTSQVKNLILLIIFTLITEVNISPVFISSLTFCPSIKRYSPCLKVATLVLRLQS